MRRTMTLAALALSGCYTSATSVELPMDLPPGTVEMLGRLPPGDAARLLAAWPKKRIGYATGDVLEKVSRSVELTRNPATGELRLNISSNHDVNVEALRAAGDVAAKAVAAAIGAVRPTPPPAAPATGGAALNPPAPSVLPVGAPAGSTLHVEGGPWLATDLLRPVSVHQIKALEIAADPGWPGKPKATPADVAALRAGLMTVGKFSELVPATWVSDPRVQ